MKRATKNRQEGASRIEATPEMKRGAVDLFQTVGIRPGIAARNLSKEEVRTWKL
jgi:hypothetical protein